MHQFLKLIFGMKIYMFRTVPLSIIRSFSLYTQQYIHPVWHVPLLCVQWKIPDDGQRNCPKHVEFHSKNKFEKSVHLVGFIVRRLSRCRSVTGMSHSQFMLLMILLHITCVRTESNRWKCWCKDNSSLFIPWGTWKGGLLYWGPCRICRGRVWRRASQSIGAPLGNLERGLLYQGLWEMDEGELWQGASLSPQGPRWGTWKGVYLPGTLRDGWRRALTRGISLSTGAPLGNLEGGSFTRDFQRWMKESSDKGHLSLHGGPAGEPGRGFIYQGH